MLYGESIFCVGIAKYSSAFMLLLQAQLKLPPNPIVGDSRPIRQVFPIKHVSLVSRQDRDELWALPLLVARLPLKSLEITLTMDQRSCMIDDWIRYQKREELSEQNEVRGDPTTGKSYLGKWRGCFLPAQLTAIAMVPKVEVIFAGPNNDDHPCIDWLTRGLRQELLQGKSKHLGLNWLYKDLPELAG